MTPLLLIGGGGHCRSCIDVIETEGRFDIKGIVQPRKDGLEPVFGYPILGEDADLPQLLTTTPYALVTVGQIKSPATRIALYELLKKYNVNIPVVVSPKAHVSRHATVAEGSIVMHEAIVNAGASVGPNTIVNNMALIEHDVKIGAHCHISTGSRVNGYVFIESGCFIGSGAVIREGVRIGSNSVIGAGCFIARDVPPDTLIR